MFTKLIKFTAGGLLIILLACGVYWGICAVAPPEEGADSFFPAVAREKPVLSADNILRKEIKYLCGDTEVTFQGMVPESMWGKEISEIAVQYPAEQGWIIDTTNKPLIVLTKQVTNFCPEHTNYRHLGITRNKLAVYEGPLGYNQKLLRVEESLSLNKLDQGLREALQQASDFESLSLSVQEALRQQLEFKNEQELNAVLENVDEMG